MKLVHVVFRDEFFQGEFVERNLAGVFSSPEKADEAVYDLESDSYDMYDPTARTIYTTSTVELDAILETE
jgi:hypothetical protein